MRLLIAAAVLALSGCAEMKGAHVLGVVEPEKPLLIYVAGTNMTNGVYSCSMAAQGQQPTCTLVQVREKP